MRNANFESVPGNTPPSVRRRLSAERGLLTGILVASGVVACLFAYSSANDQVVVDMPTRLVPSIAEEETLQLQPAKAGTVRASLPTPGTPRADVSPVDTLSTASTPSKHAIVFEVEALVNDKVSRGIATEMLAAAEAHYRAYQLDRNAAGDHAVQTAMGDFFFAVWPDLSRLISEGKIETDIHGRVHPRTNIGDGVLAFSFSIDDQELVATFHLPNWFVSLEMTAATGFPDLFASVAAMSEQQLSKQGR